MRCARELLDPLHHDQIDGLEPADVTALSYIGVGSAMGGPVTTPCWPCASGTTPVDSPAPR